MLRALGMLHWSGGRLLVSKAHTVLQEGTAVDAALLQQVQNFVQGFGVFVAQQKKS